MCKVLIRIWVEVCSVELIFFKGTVPSKTKMSCGPCDQNIIAFEMQLCLKANV